MKKIKLGTQGFSLAEVMVAAGVMGIVAIGLMKLTENQVKAVKTVETTNEVVSLVSSIRTVLATSQSCTATFVNNPANGGAPYQYNQGVLNDPMSLRYVTAPGPIVDRFTANANVNAAIAYGNGNVKILSYQLDDSDPTVGIPAGDTIGTTHLVVRFYRGKGRYGDQVITKRILLNVERVSAADNTLVSCNTSSTGVGVAVSFCASIMGNYVQGTPDVCNLAPWRDLTVVANNSQNMALSENYLKDLLLLGDPAVTTLQLGNDIALDILNINANTNINGPTTMAAPLTVNAPTTFNENVTIADGFDLTMSSDRRLKKNIHSLHHLLTQIRKMEPSSFRWKNSGKPGIGFVAQDLAQLFPEFVYQNKQNGFLSINYPQLVTLSFQGIKELDQNLEQLHEEMNQLKKENQDARKELASLKKWLCTNRSLSDCDNRGE